MEKTIWKVLGIIIVAFLSFGIGVPYLVSAKSDIAVMLGFALAILTVYFVIKTTIKLTK